MVVLLEGDIAMQWYSYVVAYGAIATWWYIAAQLQIRYMALMT